MASRNTKIVHLGRDTAANGKSAPVGKSWFFGVGIDHYVEFPNLNNAVKDVQDVISLLIENYGFSQDQIITIFNEQANQENLIDELDQLTEKVGKHDNLLIYFSGHGHLNKNTGMGFWIPHDAKSGKTARYIRNSTIRDYLKDIRSRHTLLISDSCFSGSLFVRGARRSSVALDELGSIPSRWAICSGRHDEQVCDGEPGGNSPFAESILDVLKRNKNEQLNVMKLADRVIEQTRSNYEQLPEGKPLYGVGDKGGQYIFHLQAQEDKFWEDCQRRDAPSGYSQYLTQFPRGQYECEALTRLKELEDEMAWRDAEKPGTISALQSYITDHSDGKFVEEAHEKILILEERLDTEAEKERRLNAGAKRATDTRYKAEKEHLEAEAAISNQWTKQHQKTETAATKDESELSRITKWVAGIIGVLLAVFTAWQGYQYFMPAVSGYVEPSPAKTPVEFVHLYELACDGGSMTGCFNLGLAYANGNGVTKDPAVAALLYKKACNGGESPACTYLGLAYAEGDGITQDLLMAAQLFMQACDGGESLACTQLGLAYKKGNGVTQDFAKAAQLFKQACDGGNMMGCATLGLAYWHGNGVTQDFAKAAQLYKQGCDGGYMMGCATLGSAYLEGNGVKMDPAKAAQLFKQACNGGELLVCLSRAFDYLIGRGVTKDILMATQFFQQACDGGKSSACSFLGSIYAEGEDTPQDFAKAAQDFAKAAQLFKQACDGGNMMGCDKLGLAYAEGNGVAKDLAKAAQFYKQACDGGGMSGCGSLGLAYAGGHGVTKDLAKAEQFYKQACDGGYSLGCKDLENLSK